VVSVPELKTERKCFVDISAILFSGIHRPPYRGSFRIMIAGREQQLRLVRSQRSHRFCACGPPLETPFR
jgi:hypothetical protein